MVRIVESELLDALPPEDPRAIQNRTEIHHINQWMGNYRWMADKWSQIAEPQHAVLELGAGSHHMAKTLFKRGLANKDYSAIDLVDRPMSLPTDSHWIKIDVDHYSDWKAHRGIISNFFIHQLSDESLHRLGKVIHEHMDWFIFNEPMRSKFHCAMAPLVFRLFGYNDVTRHDGLVSIRAGFKEREMSQFLNLNSSDWTMGSHQTITGCCRFWANRRR